MLLFDGWKDLTVIQIYMFLLFQETAMIFPELTPNQFLLQWHHISCTNPSSITCNWAAEKEISTVSLCLLLEYYLFCHYFIIYLGFVRTYRVVYTDICGPSWVKSKSKMSQLTANLQLWQNISTYHPDIFLMLLVTACAEVYDNDSFVLIWLHEGSSDWFVVCYLPCICGFVTYMHPCFCNTSFV